MRLILKWLLYIVASTHGMFTCMLLVMNPTTLQWEPAAWLSGITCIITLAAFLYLLED